MIPDSDTRPPLFLACAARDAFQTPEARVEQKAAAFEQP